MGKLGSERHKVETDDRMGMNRREERIREREEEKEQSEEREN